MWGYWLFTTIDYLIAGSHSALLLYPQLEPVQSHSTGELCIPLPTLLLLVLSAVVHFVTNTLYTAYSASATFSAIICIIWGFFWHSASGSKTRYLSGRPCAFSLSLVVCEVLWMSALFSFVSSWLHPYHTAISRRRHSVKCHAFLYDSVMILSITLRILSLLFRIVLRLISAMLHTAINYVHAAIHSILHSSHRQDIILLGCIIIVLHTYKTLQNKYNDTLRHK